MSVNMNELSVGLAREIEFDVNEERSAVTIGSGTLQVLGTPAIAVMVEQVCRGMVDPLLDAGKTTVGSLLKIKHLAPTPIGDVIRLRAEIISIERNTLAFEVRLWDSVELVGEAHHQRVIIDVQRFLERVHSKQPHTR
jgi:fluoroacetyl-CoA thioesterase